MKVSTRIQHAWNAFMNRAPTNYNQDLGFSSASRPDRQLISLGNERTIIASIYTRIGIDVAQNKIEHVRLDEEGKYHETIKSTLNECLTVSANIDQTGRELIQDIVMSMMDEGCVAVVPTVCDIPPVPSGAFDIIEMRTGKIIEWYPEHVRVNIYDDRRGQHYELIVPKKEVAIIQNPLYEVMNGPNSTLQRLIRTLNHLDSIDSKIASKKLDLLIQVPYSIHTMKRQKMANIRRDEIEKQVASSEMGIAYIDGMERVIQLNRPVENNLLAQAEYLTSMLYSQLGLTQGVFDGTAEEKEILNYQNRTVKPFITAIVEEMSRKFLTKTARTQGQTIMYFIDPFKMASAEEFAEMSDRLTRNAILTSNEVRAKMGYKPSSDPDADALRNKNLNKDKNDGAGTEVVDQNKIKEES